MASIESVHHKYIIIENEKDLKDFVTRALTLKEICFDSETTSINPLDSELVALSFSWEKGSGYLVHFPESQEETREKLENLKAVFENQDILKIGQNMKFDIQVLANYGIEVKGPFSIQ